MDDPSTKPPAGIMITPMHADHLDALADLESMAFSIPWSYDALAEELQNPLAVFYVAEDVDAESAVGYIGMHHILDEGAVTNIVVHPACRRQGIANALFDAYMSVTGGQKSLVWARIGNEAAERFYETHDYRPDGWNSVVLQYGGTEQ